MQLEAAGLGTSAESVFAEIMWPKQLETEGPATWMLRGMLLDDEDEEVRMSHLKAMQAVASHVPLSRQRFMTPKGK